jgi:hypothetical protein
MNIQMIPQLVRFVFSIARTWSLTAGFKADAFADIPNQASIKTAKEKRERLCELGITPANSPSDGFISLSRRDQGPHPESRLPTRRSQNGRWR